MPGAVFQRLPQWTVADQYEDRVGVCETDDGERLEQERMILDRIKTGNASHHRPRDSLPDPLVAGHAGRRTEDPGVHPVRHSLYGSARQPDGSWLFTADGSPTNSVRVVGRRTADAPSGTVGTFYGGGGLRLGFRYRLTLRVEARSHVFIEPDRYVDQMELSVGLTVFF